MKVIFGFPSDLRSIRGAFQEKGGGKQLKAYERQLRLKRRSDGANGEMDVLLWKGLLDQFTHL